MNGFEVFTIERLARRTTEALAVALSFVVDDCGVGVVAEAVFEIALPSGADAARSVTRLTVNSTPGASSGSRQSTALAATVQSPSESVVDTIESGSPTPSCTDTVLAVDGPSFRTLISNRTGSPATTGDVRIRLVTTRSALGATGVVIEAELSDGEGSNVPDETAAVFDRAVVRPGSTVPSMLTVTVAPGAKSPSAHETSDRPEHEPDVVAVAVAVKSFGNASVTAAARATDGPLLVTSRV